MREPIRPGRDPRPTGTLKLLVAVDFSKEADAALAAARVLALRTCAKLVLCHVRPVGDVHAAVAEGRNDLIHGTDGELRDALSTHYEEKLFAFRPGASEKVRLRRGHPVIELVREAARGYDLIVVGYRGRGGVAAALLGSTTQELLHRSPVPVLVVAGRP